MLNLEDWLHPPTQHRVRADSEVFGVERINLFKQKTCSFVFSQFFSLFPMQRAFSKEDIILCVMDKNRKSERHMPSFCLWIITLNYILFLWNGSPKYCVECFSGVKYEYSRNINTAFLDRKVVSAFCLLCVRCQLSFRQGKKQNSSIISGHVPLLHAGLAQSHDSGNISRFFQDWCLLWCYSHCSLFFSLKWIRSMCTWIRFP